MAHTYVELFSKAIIIVKLNLIKNIYDVYLLLVFLQVFIINTPNFEDFLIESGKYHISFEKIFSSFVSKALSFEKYLQQNQIFIRGMFTSLGCGGDQFLMSCNYSDGKVKESDEKYKSQESKVEKSDIII